MDLKTALKFELNEKVNEKFEVSAKRAEEIRMEEAKNMGSSSREMPSISTASLKQLVVGVMAGEIDQSIEADALLSPYLYTVADKTTRKKTHGAQFAFEGYEINIARYALTTLAKDCEILGEPTSSIVDSASTIGIETNVKERTVVYNNILATFQDGIISGIFFPNSGIYRVEIVSKSKAGLNSLVKKFGYELERSNFYQGKCLRIGDKGINFIDVPTVKLDEVVLPEKIRRGYLDNTVHFLTCPNMHKITKKRGVILYGPPGTGKTSLVSATFNRLNEEYITCLYVTGDSFRKIGFDETFRFVIKYLAPCMIVLEDFDLLAFDRAMGNRGLIGDILSWLNGIEDMKKPIVVVGSTNRFDVLDAAATRPCRFDRRYKLDFPNEKETGELWEKMIGTSPNGIKNYIGKVTGAHIREISNTARMMAEATGKSVGDCAEQALEEVIESFLLVMPKSVGFQPNRELNEGIAGPTEQKICSDETVGDLIRQKTGL